MTTIRDVARLAKVSATTVSATLSGNAPVSEALQKRVWDAVKQANYRPDPIAQNLRRGATKTIGFIAPDIATPWAAHMARAAQKSLAEQGYNMLLASNEDNVDREMNDISLMISHRVAGLLIAPTSLGPDYEETFLRNVTCPAVLIDRVVAPQKFDIVADDNQLGGALIADYLVRLGHSNIGFLVGRDGISASYERFNSTKTAFARAGRPLKEEFIRHDVHTLDGAYAVVQEIMTMPDRPTALICISNPQVQGTMAGLSNMGMRVPEDVSVISFDGFNPPEGWSPIIASLVQDTFTISNTAVKQLLERIRNPGEFTPELTRIQPRLRVGNSCRPVI